MVGFSFEKEVLYVVGDGGLGAVGAKHLVFGLDVGVRFQGFELVGAGSAEDMITKEVKEF